jgi:DNA-binding transcriptional LysR family regulator
MLLSIRELEVFRLVMERGSVTGAARALHITQPAVSKMLQQAEARLGFSLFLRNGRTLRPTAEAQALFPETLSAFAAFEVVQRLAGALQGGVAGALSIAVIPSLANSIMPLAIARFRTQLPEVAVVLHAVPAPEVVRLVEDQRVELGAVIGPVGGRQVAVSDTCITELACLMPAGHPLAAHQAIQPADLQPWPLIAPGGRWPLGAQLNVVFADANVPLRIAVAVDHATVAGALVRSDAGIAVLDRFGLLSAQGPELVVRPLLPKAVSVARILIPRFRPASRQAKTFRLTLLQVAKECGVTFTASARQGPLTGS